MIDIGFSLFFISIRFNNSSITFFEISLTGWYIEKRKKVEEEEEEDIDDKGQRRGKEKKRKKKES